MGAKDKKQSILSEASSLIDFLYVDKERVDSFISQTRNGTLRSVTKNIGTSEGSAVSCKVGVPAIAKAMCNHSQESFGNSSENYDPYHSQLMKLLADLEIHPLDELPKPCTSKLVLLKSNVLVRDMASIKAVMPAFTGNNNPFNKGINKETRNILKFSESIIKLLPDFIGLSVFFNGTNITGTLKAKGLSINQFDLMRTYGIELPGEWYVLGILDFINKPNISSPITSMENVVDEYTRALGTLYSNTNYKIIPILIFREIYK